MSATAQAELPGDPPIAIHLRRNAQARRISLRVSRLDGRVTLSLPPRARLAEALAFAREREDWIRAALARNPVRGEVVAGSVIPFEGRLCTIAEAPVLKVRAEADRLLVPPGAARAGERVGAFLKAAARQRIEAACRRHAATLGRDYAAITLRDTRSRWGSCTADGRLMFSWRLVMAPPEVLDYVAAHEVAHLVRMDHSPAFWAEVARLVPDFARHRRWLTEQGQGLHSHVFAPSSPPPAAGTGP